MNIRPLFAQLVKPNTQFDLTEERFNHDAIAVYLHEKNKRVWKNRPVYLVAGTEDLRDLLTRIPMQFDGDTAFIFFRSHTHAIIISLLRLDGKVIAYYYDPQAWGMQNYPTRIAYDVLINTYPGITVFVSRVEIQSKGNQRGCTEHGLDCLDYLLKPDCNWMEMLPGQRAVKAGESLYLLDESVYPQVLKGLNVAERHVRNRDEIEKWLAESYVSKDGIFQWREVERVVRLMQGAELTQWLFDGPKLYNTSIDLNTPTVKLTFTHDSYVYANCLTHTTSIFPSTRCRVVLDDNQNVKVQHDERAQTLTFTADSVEKLLTEFYELSKTPDRYLARQMRQQQGLAAFAKDMVLAIQMERELMAVLNSTKGGMDPRQVQQALQFIFRHDPATIYVPYFEELSGENTKLDLLALKQRGLQTLIATMPVDDEHQVAMKIDLTVVPFNISIYNSSNYGYSESRLKKRLSDVFGEKISINDVKPRFKKQTNHDIWACGVHVIANIEAELGRRACAVDETLDAKELARTYLRAWRHQQEEDEKQWNYRHVCVAFTEKLHKAVQEVSGFPTESLLKFLSGYVGTGYTELRRATPIAQLVREYEKTNGSDTFGVTVLRFCNLVFPKLELIELFNLFDLAKNPPATKGLYEHAAEKYGDSWQYDTPDDLTDVTFDAVVVDLQLFVNQQPDSLEFLRTARTVLFAGEEPGKVIAEFFRLIECEYSISNIKDPKRFIQLMILEVCSQAAKYDGVVLNEKRSIQVERTAKDERIKKMLTQLGVYQGEMTPAVTELMQLPENVIVNLTSKVHLAILSVVTDVSAKMTAIKKFIELLRINNKNIFTMIEIVDKSLSAAQAILNSMPVEALADNYERATPDRLCHYILSHPSADFTNQPEVLITYMREWKAAGLKLSISMLDTFRTRLSADVVRQLFEIIASGSWTNQLLEDYLKFFNQEERYAAISKIVWQSDAKLLISVLKSNFHRFSDQECLDLFTGFKGEITQDQVNEIFGCRTGYSSLATTVNSSKRQTKFDQRLCEWLFENRPELLRLKQFFVNATPEMVTAVTVARSSKLAAMIAAWDVNSYSLRHIVADNCYGRVDEIFKLYADVLHLDADIIKYIDILPRAEKAAAAMRYNPPVHDRAALREILSLFNTEQRDAYIRKHLDKFNSVEIVQDLIARLSDSSVVLEVIQAKKELFKDQEGGVCSRCNGRNCGNRQNTSGAVIILNSIGDRRFIYDAFLLLIDKHKDMNELFVTLEKLLRSDEVKCLSTYHAQLAELIKRSDSSYVANINNKYGRDVAMRFIETYLSCLDTDNLVTAMEYHSSFTSKQLKRGRPLLKDARALLLMLRHASDHARYLILQRNVGVLQDLEDWIKVLGCFDINHVMQILLDYKDEIISKYKVDRRTPLSNLFSFRGFADKREVCLMYLGDCETSKDFLSLLKKSCLTDDDRMQAMLQADAKVKSNFLPCIETVTEPHPDMIKLFNASPECLKSAMPTELTGYFAKVLPKDRVALLQAIIAANKSFTPGHALKVVLSVPHEHRLEFITKAVELTGSERWQLLRYLPENQSFVTLASSMIKSEEDFLQFAQANFRHAEAMMVVEAKQEFISSQNLIGIMRASDKLSDFIVANKLGLVKSHELLRQVLKEVPEKAYEVGASFITDFSWLVTVMSCLTTSQAAKALKAHKALVVDDCDLSTCLLHLDEKARIGVAVRYERHVRTQDHFERMLNQLSQDDCYTYVKASTFRPTIARGWLDHLSPIARYEYLSNRDLKDEEMLNAVESLIPEHRLLFVCEKMSSIKSAATFNKIRPLFTSEGAAMLDLHWNRVSKERDKKSSVFWGMFDKADEKQGAIPKKAGNKPVVVAVVSRTKPVSGSIGETGKRGTSAKNNASGLRSGFFVSEPANASGKDGALKKSDNNEVPSNKNV